MTKGISDDMDTVLDVKNLSISFKTTNGMVQAVRNVSFSVHRGETLAIVGESGCGKSVTARAIMGIQAENAVMETGEIIYGGRDLTRISEREFCKLRGSRLSMVLQDPLSSLNPVVRVGKQLAEAVRMSRANGRVSGKAARDRAIFLMGEAGIPDAAARYAQYPFQLSGGMRQRVVIAAALAANPELLICDEPTSALDTSIQAQILELISNLKEKRRLSVVFITHDLSVVANIADSIAVMNAGSITEYGGTRDVFGRPEHPYTRALIASVPGMNECCADKKIPQDSNNTILSVQNLRQYFRIRGKDIKAVDGVSFVIRKGEVLGLVGESGCGKTTTGRCIIRLNSITGGDVFFMRKRTGTGVPERREQVRAAYVLGDSRLAESLKQRLEEDMREVRASVNGGIMSGMQMIFQDPVSSLNPRMTIREIIAEGLVIRGIKDKTYINKRVGEALDMVSLAASTAGRYPHEFSGGQRQRVAIARAVLLEPSLLIADEPVSALDMFVQAQIIDLLNGLRQSMGLAILFIAHNLSVVRHFCDRVAVMRSGRIVETAEAGELFARPRHPYTRELMDCQEINRASLRNIYQI